MGGTYSLYSLYTKYLQASAERYRLVKIAYENGDRAAMDTLEALTQVQSFMMLQSDAKMKLNDAAIDLSNYLWQDNDSAYDLPSTFVPDTLQFAMEQQAPQLDQLIRTASDQNPALKSYSYKLDALAVERKLKFQSLLPVVNAKSKFAQ